ncbi:MAG: aldo/keto reductase [Bacteroidales bacterium]|nr:aldo/keto reductase [Bacteroidales bacterium]
MVNVKLSEDLTVSGIAQGLWRLDQWDMSDRKLLKYVEEALDMGVTTFDHADIYGDYTCEQLFGRIFTLKPGLRKRMQLITKCGIKLLSPKYPQRKLKHYDTGYDHIISSVEQSLKNLQTDYIDLLLVHRPDPLMDPASTAKAFERLFRDGKVLHFGVSNFTPLQYQMLSSYYSGDLVTNQIEVSPYQLEHLENGNLDFLMKERIRPMGWSPLAGGNLYQPADARGLRVKQKLEEVAGQLGVDDMDKVIYAWVLRHPAGIIPVVGTGKTGRLARAVDALKIPLTREQWFGIYAASLGHDVP